MSNIKPSYRSIDKTNLSQEKFNQILCPNIRTGIRMSLLNPDQDGWTQESEIRNFLTYIGVRKNSKVQDLLITTGYSAVKEKRKGQIKLTAFEGTFLDHGSSSGILNNSEGFSFQRLEQLKNFANQDSRLTHDELNLASNNFHQCPFKFKSTKGTHIFSFEISALLEIYGRSNDSNKKYFSPEDIDSLWKENRFPADWTPPEQSFYGTSKAFFNYLSAIFKRFRMGWRKKQR